MHKYVIAIFHLTFSIATADTWTWDPNTTGGTSPGGTAVWDGAAVRWWDGNTNRAWNDGASTSASISSGTATVSGPRVVHSVNLGAPATLAIPQANLGNRLTLNGNLSGPGKVYFSGKWTVSRYDAALMNTGLRFEGGGALTVDADFTVENLFTSPVITVSGAETVVTYRGNWKGDGGQTYPHLFLRNGGTFVLHGDAELDFINEAYYTRQLWISGGGPEESDGVLDFAADFVADRTQNGTVDNGLGSIRLNNAVVVTRHTQSIPVGYRPRPGHPDGPQTNGHFVFEHNPGMWIIRENPQTYAGALWFRTNAEIRTEADLTHTGVTEDDTSSSYPYRAGNAFQTNADDLVIRKTGNAALILAGEQAYKPGTEFRVEAGTLRFLTDPAGGNFVNQIGHALDPAGPDLDLVVNEDSRADFVAPTSEIASLDADGALGFELTAGDGVKLRVHGNAEIAGPVHLSYTNGFTPVAGTAFTLIDADTLTWTPTDIIAAPGVRLSVTEDNGKIILEVLPVPGDDTELLLLDEEFQDLAAWDDLSTAVTWTSTPSATTVFQTTSDGATPHVLNLNDASRSVGMWGSNGIRSYSAIDQQFATPISHRDHEVTIEFRIRWDKLDSNEGNRVIFTLTHDYPAGGLDLTPDAKVGDLTQDWFARPAYQVRIRSGPTQIPGNMPIFLYGGGHDPDGEFEKGIIDGSTQWLAGFSSGANGTSPGVGSPYPDNSWILGDTAPASTSYRRFRYVVKPNLQELWVNEADDGASWTKVGDMPIPFEEDAPATAPLYRYFEQFEGLRVYFRSAGAKTDNYVPSNVYLDYVRLTAKPLPEFNSYSEWAAAANFPSGEDGPGDDPYVHGVTNFERYALGYAPDTPPPSTIQPRMTASGGNGMFHFQRPLGGRPDVDYLLWITDDLTANNWTTLNITDASIIVEDGQTETVRIEAPGLDLGPVFVALEMLEP
jgi:hypothetical protein